MQPLTEKIETFFYFECLREDIINFAKNIVMKNISRSIIVIAAFLLVPLSTVFADTPPDPGSGGPGGGDQPVGGGAPIGGGLIIMAALGAGYASKKIFDARNKILE